MNFEVPDSYEKPNSVKKINLFRIICYFTGSDETL